ncbi:hypothetical protein CISIN_1g044995mg, partial [Citrus sinensis]
TIKKTKLFISNELEKATDSFNVNRILGQGGQDIVYKGMAKVEKFINEVVIQSQINHINVVKLIGCCLETKYMHDQNKELPFTWEMQLRISIEASGTMSYLHLSASVPIYHRDIKSTNILLDDKYCAKVSNFGTSRSRAVDQTHITTQVHGTFGYLNPDDVCSFGVVLVELLTGAKPIRFTTFEEDKNITVAKHAKRCLNPSGKKRPAMKEVASELAGIKAWNGASNVMEEGILGRAPTVGGTFKPVPQPRLEVPARTGRHRFSQQMRLPCDSNWGANPVKPNNYCVSQ